jgi:predicted double-glycine peptidase
VPVASVKEARQRRTVIQQLDFSCGSAAVATLLTHHYRFPVSEQVVFEAMYTSGDAEKIKVEGFSMLDMKRVLLANGFQADGFEATLDRLAEARLPAIALINEKGYGHFVVVKGLRDGRVLLGDPASGLRAMPRRAFEAVWTNGILFVVSSHQDVALFDSDADWQGLPRAPLAAGVLRESLAGVVIPKLGPADN